MSETTTPCIRGCTMRGRHIEDCDDHDICRGCLPRLAEFGLLCYTCHIRLAEAVQLAPMQAELLDSSLVPSSQTDYSSPPKAKLSDGWRMDSGDPHYIYVMASQHGASDRSLPLRVTCLDTARELADLLSQFVDHLAQRYDAVPPPVLTTAGEGGDRRRKAWRGGEERDEGRYVWIDPDPTYGVSSASRWLLGNLARWELLETVGDDAEALFEVMSRAHALAPWREEAKRLPGIPCPYCKRSALKKFGGKEDVTCTACETDIPHERYLIWARIYEEETA